MNDFIYLDSGATMQKPQSVIDAELDFMQNKYANAGRGICAPAAAVDAMVERARARAAAFINAAPHQIVFTSGATDGLNRVVHLIGGGNLRVSVSGLDHNSARIPWQMRPDTEIIELPLDDNLNIDIANIPNADVYVITAMSNVLGVAQNVGEISRVIREKNASAKIVVDAAQFAVHDVIDAVKWDVDFICFSGHKIGADTGVGILYIKHPDQYAPDKFGGGMVLRADENQITFVAAPNVFESGTLPLTQIAGLMPAIDYIESNRPNLELIKYAFDALSKNPKIRILTSRDASILSFVIDGMHILDFGAMMGAHGVCVRVGNMCAPWIMNKLGIDGCVRVSIGSQNTIDDVQRAVSIIGAILK